MTNILKRFQLIIFIILISNILSGQSNSTGCASAAKEFRASVVKINITIHPRLQVI